MAILDEMPDFEAYLAKGIVESIMSENDRMQKENAKLRELVRELYECSRQTGCDPCGYADRCHIKDDMRELGIEVE